MKIIKTKLTMPVLPLGGRYIPLLGGKITMSAAEYGKDISSECTRNYSFKFGILYSRRAAAVPYRSAL
jgi:hypothetical protein